MYTDKQSKDVRTYIVLNEFYSIFIFVNWLISLHEKYHLKTETNRKLFYINETDRQLYKYDIESTLCM